ncbi:DUF58 domain-containing protein [Leucothrix pacifica]|uniref:DUF58 domain-containing protein n=2 Tax=Leucothrix pacifica TaxID=1247513 RepID=A0A317CNV5_9GAMM|nr:DUF58 domain-containing protein [Leucothrix pacifica]
MKTAMKQRDTSGAGLVFSTLDSLLSQQQSARMLMQKNRYRKATKQAGNHQVRQLGRGMEFAESRPYSPGDDIRSMDWKVTARTGEPHTKLFEEERERPVLLWCDFRPSMFFATRGQFKSVVMCELSAILSWKSWLSGDRIGALLLSGSEHMEMRPARSKSKVLQLLQRLADYSMLIPDFSVKADVSLADSWQRLRRVLSPGSQVVLLSDFRSLDAEAEQQLRRIARHANLTLVAITDPFEHQLPEKTQLKLSDGLRFLRLNTAKAGIRKDYRERDLSHTEQVRQLAMQCHANLIEVSTADSEQVRLAKLRGAGV